MFKVIKNTFRVIKSLDDTQGFSENVQDNYTTLNDDLAPHSGD